MIGATIELLVPQAHVVVIEARRLAQWVTEDVLEVSGQTAAPQALQAIGAVHAREQVVQPTLLLPTKHGIRRAISFHSSRSRVCWTHPSPPRAAI